MSKLMLKEMMNHVKENSANHPKYIKKMMNLYQKSALDDFVDDFVRILEQMFVILDERNPQLKRTMLFCSQFCAEVTRKEDEQEQTSNFLTAIVARVLKYTDNIRVEVRNNSCTFIKLLLQDLGSSDMDLDADLCDDIQEAMLERILDPKVSIKLQAISTMPRLQDPYDVNCPIIKAYLSAIHDPNSSVRCRVIQVMAVNKLTLMTIRDRVRDVDHTVRTAAFQRCADINPKHFKIVDRHHILQSGFAEQHQVAKAAFVNGLLAKWVTAYEGDFLAFVRGLKLSSTDDDMATMVYITNHLLPVFHNKYSVNDLIDVLPISKTEKLVPFNDLTNDVALYWSVLANLLRRADDMEDYLDALLPELTPLCHYIEKYVETTVAKELDEWAYLDFQFNLVQIFKIVEKYDFSDEVGRRTLRALIMAMLHKYELTEELLAMLLPIVAECSSSMEVFTNDVCELISEIREPMVEVAEAAPPPLSEQQLHQNKFKMAQLNVKLNMLDMEEENAVADKDYKKAQQISNQMDELRKEIEALREQQTFKEEDNNKPSNKVRTVKTDVKTVCRCLDLVVAMLQVVAVDKLTPSLNSCKDEFVVPLIATMEDEVHWRMLRCLALFSIIDRPTAEKYCQMLSIPIATYRTTANFNVPAMVASISAMSDLIRVHGCDDILSSDKSTDDTANAAKRRLFNHENDEHHLTPNGRIENMTLTDIYQIFLDMLDGECEVICQTAFDALYKMVLDGLSVNSSFISRILIKWYNPLTKKNTLLQTKLGHFIQSYVNLPNTRDIFVGSAIPTISSLANAPRTSPLSDVDLDNVVSFFSQLIEADDARILALDLCMKIAENVDDKVVVHLAKLLNQLKLTTTTLAVITELLQRAEQLLEDVTNKTAKKYIEKFASNLREKERIFKERPSESVAATVEAAPEDESGDAGTEASETVPIRSFGSKERFSGLPAAESTRVRVTGSIGVDDESQAKRQRRLSKMELPCKVFLSRLPESKQQLDVIDETTLETDSVPDSFTTSDTDTNSSSMDSKPIHQGKRRKSSRFVKKKR